MRDLFTTIARIAGRQHGRVTAAQLARAGADRRVVWVWCNDGLLHREHVGVYAVGHRAPSLLGDLMSAVLASGDGAVLSHASVGHALRLGVDRPRRPEVTIPTLHHRRRPGITIHRAAHVPVLDVAVWHGIPITTVPRAMLDLAPRLEPQELTRAGHEALVNHGTTPVHVEACIARNPTKKGIRKLRLALSADVTLSHLEDGFLALLESNGLPLPRTNIDHRGDKVDCHWPKLGLTIELHGYRFHASRHAFEQDVARRRRSAHLAFTYGDVFERPVATIAELRPLLSRGR